MTQPSGWYDDPQDPSQLRYWDGVVWSSHVSPKVSPSVEKSNIGMPYGVSPASARPQSAGSQGAQGAPSAQGGYGSAQHGEGQPGTKWPAYGQGSGSVGGQQPGWRQQGNTTPDGVPLAGWWLRVLARFLDGIFAGLLALPFTGYFYYQYILGALEWSEDLASQAASGSAPLLALPPSETLQFAFQASIIGVLVSLAYEVFFLNRGGATPGKKIAGISVRLRDRPGPMPMRSIVSRAACFFGLSLVNFAGLLDVLWPLWDSKKQALHDKVAATNVVVGPQPKRDA